MTEGKNPVEPGEILAGKYRVERVIGKGGMGVVVAAMHLQLEQLVALKFLLPEAAKNPDVVGRFAREARAAVKLQSEHVARVSDVGTLENGAPFMVMEYLEGKDLAKVIDKEGALDPHEAVDFVLQACEAIAEAHALGIVHRDLKPSNLFLAKRSDRTRVVKVLDFGISKLTGGPAESAVEPSLTRTTDVLGSPMYMSPEQLRSSRSVDARSDIWSLGVILFEILTLESPFKVGTLAEICGAILHEQPKRLADVRAGMPEELEAVILGCLEKKAENRYQSVFELAEALEPFGGDTAPASMTQISRFAPPRFDGGDDALATTMVARHSPDNSEDLLPARSAARTTRAGGRAGAGSRTTGGRTGDRTTGGGRRATTTRTVGGRDGVRASGRRPMPDVDDLPDIEVGRASHAPEFEPKATAVAWGEQPPRSTMGRSRRSAWPWALALFLVLGVGVGAAFRFGYVDQYVPGVAALIEGSRKFLPKPAAKPVAVTPSPVTAQATTPAPAPTASAAPVATTEAVSHAASSAAPAASAAPSATASASASVSASASADAHARAVASATPTASAAASKPTSNHGVAHGSDAIPEPTVAPERVWKPGEYMPSAPQAPAAPKPADPYGE